MKTSVSRILVGLVGLMALMLFVFRQAEGQTSDREPNQLLKVANREGQTGFIDKTGRLVIGFERLPKTAIGAGDFHEGLATIFIRKDKNSDDTVPVFERTQVGYIDETGKIVIAPQFDLATDFSEGLAYVEKGNLKGFIDRRGKMVIELGPDILVGANWELPGFHQGLAAVRGGFIDRTGKLVIEGFAYTESFSQGLAAVANSIRRDARYGFVNRKGEMAIPFRFEPELEHHGFVNYLGPFAEGLARVRLGGLYGYIDTRGEFRIAPQFTHAKDFSGGLAFVNTKSKVGYIDKTGRFVIDGKDFVYTGGRFSEGLASVTFKTKDGVKAGYINRTGKVVIAPRFDGAREFIGGVAQVYELRDESAPQETRFGYIDKRGRYIWEPRSGREVRKGSKQVAWFSKSS